MTDKDLSYILKLRSNEAVRLGKETTDIDVVLTLSKHPDPMVRKKALVEMCPCRVKADLDRFWERVFEMKNDESNIVRAQVLHTLCDGSPKHLEHRISLALEDFNIDPDTEIRRKAHKVMSSYHRTGKWNIL
ncbi:hypothetical protein BpHYR1_053236 [Brachionus plicatilis]|uniref:HEAT repeat domain-containing protein n=1 Tax=Brachionus plicatilis TaxID=10195 RepID=A0A3M7SHN4_BRAPC|nr:hypothetical protein BpHYR1_053236 [Brachionus plicatilis]